MSNKYFKNTLDQNNNEATLYRNACHEICEQKGIDMVYLPRTIIDLDNIFGEDSKSEFKKGKIITLYIENYQNYDGVGEIFSKFGFTPDHQLILIVESNHCDNLLGQTPIEGDLIYHPAGDKFFEIVHINEKDGFYQLNNSEFMYRFQCKLFEYSYEDIETGISDIDIINQEDQDSTDESDQITEEETEFLNLDESNIFGNL